MLHRRYSTGSFPKKAVSWAEDNEKQPTPSPGSDSAGGNEAPSPDATPQLDPGPKPAAPAGSEADAKPVVPKPPPKKPAAAAKPKGPQQEPWSDALVDALKEKFSGQVLDSYTFLSQRQLVVKKDQLTEILEFLRRNEIEPFDFLSDETATHWPEDEEFELVFMVVLVRDARAAPCEDAHQGMGIDRKPGECLAGS